MADDNFGANDDFWLFGYGSLIWKPPPHYDLRVPGYIEGYVRRFWQVSEDHRGTPEAPGRVVTLIDRAHWETLVDEHPSPHLTWGAAYHIPQQHVAEVRNYLDIREINGYSIQYTPFHPSHSPADPSVPKPIKCLVYIGLPENPQFLGPQDPQELAAHILKSRGPSGENREYLFMLEEALLGLSPESGDGHISDLVSRCREIEGKEYKGDDGKRVEIKRADFGGVELHKVGSTEEQEEVEK
ncbi:ChaC-domain-containing protein [Mytilinidion resinicola]|uniref:glutathione-specific gamma-glutamylcyclotransferase n=1 Tax=Mytilinidion resinicola TaxID=574789 RepID=A0A6A6YB85_9PEZI|nr:ChaC-domain-containing protein [Mytilinidion resinicola]KAF2806096.1 ChaC-domain-containing protein [Mytilinidion resinicola]